MVTLTQKQIIILKHLDGISNRQIAALLHISKDTVNKYVNEYDVKRAELLALNSDTDNSEIIQAFVDEPSYDVRNRGSLKATPAIVAVIDECVKANEVKRSRGMKKQEMKKIDIHEYLIKKGYDISYSTVKRIMKDIDARHAEAFIRQEYILGDICEFDWGTVKLDIADAGIQKFQMAVFTAAKSNYRFALLYRTQDTAAFQESHACFFDHSHGAFHTMVYDNMKVAVKKFVGLKEKEPTKALTELSVYYGFKFRFCNIASGWEKGHVERSVEYVRRKVFSAPGNDCFDTLAEANAFLLRECAKLNSREISNTTVPMEVFDMEKGNLLPAVPKFESCTKSDGRVDKYSTIVIAQNHYSVPDTLVGKIVSIRNYTDKVVIYYENKMVATHQRSFFNHDWQIDIYHYLRTLKRKPGALHQSTALLQSDTMIKNIYETYYSKDARTFLGVLDIIFEKGVEPVVRALKKLETLSPMDMSADKLRVVCDKTEETDHAITKPGTDRLSNNAKRTLSQYDKLRLLQNRQEKEAV